MNDPEFDGSVDLILGAAAARGDRAVVVPVQRLAEIREDLAELRRTEALNSFQEYVLDGIYELDVPDAPFPIRSIVLVATPHRSTVEITLRRLGRKWQFEMPTSYTEEDAAPDRVGSYLAPVLASVGGHLLNTRHVPMKRLAVRSGLAAYGRNNVTYVDGMGSFHVLAAFFSDVAAEAAAGRADTAGDAASVGADAASVGAGAAGIGAAASSSWSEVRHARPCRGCRLCAEACPTGAIRRDRFLIDTDRCLTWLNESGGDRPFPEWVPPSAHNCVYGCLRCQLACPLNRAYVGVHARVEFDEDETALLLDGADPARLPASLSAKVEALEMGPYLSVLPRNLKALFAQREAVSGTGA